MRQIDVVSSTRFEGSDVEHAACVKAGEWVFLNGIEATDYRSGTDAGVKGHAGLPYHGLPKHRREGDFIVARIKQLLTAAGTDFRHSVRLDQYYPTWKAVDPYHLSRTAAFGNHIPPSTSVVMKGLLGPGLEVDSSLLAVMPGTGRDPQRLSPPDVTAPTWSGFAPAMRSGDFVWRMGQLATAAQLVGLAEAALDQIVEYAKVRETFGKKIGSWQAVRHPCADMAVRLEAARSQLWFAATAMKESRRDAGVHLDAAKHLANLAAAANTDTNIQLHGGIGVTDEHHAHLYMKHALVLIKMFGARRDLLGRLLHASVED